MTILGRFQFRRDTAANWTAADPVLLSGELGLETDTGKMKMGDGATTWIDLAYTWMPVPNFVTNEVVAGGPTVWTLAHVPLTGTLQLYSGSGAIWPGGGADYTLSGDTITSNYPITAGTMHASYRY